tara:strand:- start:122 stop:514 length:393 start_codon:yes stop_codon:yes gene_type:complete
MKGLISKKKLRQFGFFIGLGFPFLIGLLIPALIGHSFRYWTFYVGLPSLFLAITKPVLLLYPYKAWISLGNFLGFINSHLILGAIFIVVLLPISIIMKILGYDPLKIKRSNIASYRQKKEVEKINLNKIF